MAIPIIDVLVILHKLTKDGHINVEEIVTTTKDGRTGEIKEVSKKDSYFISFEGVLFVENSSLIWHNRPYKWKRIKGIINAIWKIAKIIIIILNSLAILWLMYKVIPQK